MSENRLGGQDAPYRKEQNEQLERDRIALVDQIVDSVKNPRPSPTTDLLKRLDKLELWQREDHDWVRLKQVKETVRQWAADQEKR